MENSNLVWNTNERQLSISGFRRFEKSNINTIFEGDIWNRDIVVAESGLNDVKNYVKQNKPLTIVIGYSPSRPHLGYLVMNRFLRSFIGYKGTSILLGINIRESMETHNRTLEDTLKANELVEKALLGHGNTTKVCRIYDLSFLNEPSIQKTYDKIYSKIIKELTFRDFNKNIGRILSGQDFL
jgi:hypothetical protein